MRRTLLVAIPWLFLHAAAAHALGIGDIELKSALNQPFDAEIPLHSVRGEDLKAVSIGLASNTTFDKAGIDRHPVLNQLTFSIKTRRDGTSFIKVSSRQPIREPFLDFIVQVSWSAGQMQREYTVLLDPPVLTQERPAPVAPASTATAAPETAPAKPAVAAAAAPPQAAAPKPAAAPRALANEYGPTGRTDTLWSIAEQMRPDKSVSVPQTMMALLKNNPDAFYNDNINELKAGYVLRLEDRSLLTAMSKAEAERAARNQYQEWLARKRGESVTPVRPQGALPDAGRGEAAVASASDPQPRLKLVAPTEEELLAMDAAGTVSSGAGARASVAALQTELALAAETAERSVLENDELKQRIAALEGQLAEMQRLLTLQDDTAATIQAQQTGKTAEPVPAEPAPPAKPPVADAAAPSDEAGPFGSPIVLSTMLILILGVLILAWKMYRRRQLDSLDSNVFASAPVAATAGSGGAVAAVAERAANKAVTPVAFDADGQGISAETDDIDVLSEADVYLAYHRYPQAETLIKGALDHHPDRLDLKLKLLEIYFAAKDKGNFVAHAEELHDALGGVDGEGSDYWTRAAALGQEMAPEHALFGGTQRAGGGHGRPAAAGERIEEAVRRSEDNVIGFESGQYGADDVAAGRDDSRRLDVPAIADDEAGLPGAAAGDDDFVLDSSDLVATKLDLAKAYVDMGDQDGARSILEEVVVEGTDTQKQEARELLAQIG